VGEDGNKGPGNMMSFVSTQTVDPLALKLENFVSGSCCKMVSGRMRTCILYRRENPFTPSKKLSLRVLAEKLYVKQYSGGVLFSEYNLDLGVQIQVTLEI
jgi:hypothetical protein